MQGVSDVLEKPTAARHDWWVAARDSVRVRMQGAQVRTVFVAGHSGGEGYV